MSVKREILLGRVVKLRGEATVLQNEIHHLLNRQATLGFTLLGGDLVKIAHNNGRAKLALLEANRIETIAKNF